MRQLRLVGLAEDGASLVLESPTGESYRLPVDERVRAACRGDLTRLGQIEIEMDNPLRPREIQMRIRGGESAEQVAASSGMPLERVLRFAYPVLQERSRVVAQARTTAVRPPKPEPLGDLVEERLVSRGTDAGTLEWDAWRREDGRWGVRLAWRHGETAHEANWSLDLARRALQAEDPAAEQLSAEEFHARTITAVTPLAAAARAAGPSRRRLTHPGVEEAGRRETEHRPERAESRETRREQRVTQPERRVTPPAGGRPEPRAARPEPRAARPEPRAARPEPPAAQLDRRAQQDQRAQPDQRAQQDQRAQPDQRPQVEPRATQAQAAHAQPQADRRPSNPGRPRAAGGRREAEGEAGEEPPAEEVRRVAAGGGGTIPLVDAGDGPEEDRARRATVPSWDDILLGVRRRH